MTSITTNTIKAIITNTTPTFKASIVQKGADGKEVEFQTTATHIQWRYVDGTWVDLVALADLKGADGTNGIDGDDGLDGNGIVSITLTSGDHSPGTSDTYTITFDDATTTTFDVYNGADGLGSGDMLKSVYDTNSNNIVDNAEKVNNHTVETDVPSGAQFTDTVYTHPNHSGDVTSVADGAQTIANNVVGNAKLAQVAVNIIKGRKTTGTGNVEDLTVSDVLAMLSVYTQTETDNLLANKAPLSSPEFTDIPKAPTAPTGTDTTQIASTEFVQQELDVHKAESVKLCIVGRDTNLSIPNETTTPYTLTTINNINNADFASLNQDGKVVFNKSGIYLVVATVRYSGNGGTGAQFEMYIGSNWQQGTVANAPGITSLPNNLNLALLSSVESGDLLNCNAYQHSGGARDIDYSRTFIKIYRLG